MQYFKKIAEDKHWKVKASLIENYEEINNTFPKIMLVEQVIPYIQ